MNKYLIMIFALVVFTACSNTESQTSAANVSNAVFVNTDNYCKVTIGEENSQMVFRSLHNGSLEVDINLLEGEVVGRLLLYDGETLLRVEADNGRIVLEGDDLSIFRAMISGEKSIDIKGKIDYYNYFTQKLTEEDTLVISQIFEENQI